LNVVGALGDARPVLHFNGHYDVVPPGSGWTCDPFGGTLVDRRLFGRGTCDQKAGIAAAIYAVEAVRRAGAQLKGTVEQSATADEESGGFAGVGWLCDRGRLSRERQDYVVITEPLDPERVCIGHRGVYWFELTTLGRIGHGSMPGLAINAAEAMTRLIAGLDDLLRPLLQARVSAAPVEPPAARLPSINLNALHAGQPLDVWQTPTVPDRCRAVFDRRFIHEEVFSEVRDEIVRLLDRQGIPYELRDLMRVDPLLLSADSTLAQATAAAIRDVCAKEPAFIASPGTFDQKHVVRRAGIENCIGYGPGRLIQAHQPDEYVGVDDLVAATKVLALLTLRLLG
jgi:succinyl-diaminopimelate desuccinylase